MIQEPMFYLVATAAVMIAGISKSGFGGGLGIMAVPLLSLVMPPTQAAGIMLPILCLMDLFGVWGLRRTWATEHVRVLLPAAMLGIALGTLTFRYMDEGHLRLLVGLVAVAFVADQWTRRWRAQRPARASTASGVFWGTMTGFTSFLAHAGGPPANIYLLPLRLHRTVFVGTTVLVFTVVNYVKLVPYGWLGLLNAANVTTAVVLAPLAPLSIWLGIVLNRRLQDRTFYRITYVLLLLTGLKLCWDGVTDL